MVNTAALVVFTSLVLLVVSELSSITREMDLMRMAREDRQNFRMLNFIPVPNLGRFVFIHGINLSLLTLATFIIFSSANGPIGSALILTMILVYIPLLAIEVNEYDSLSINGLPESLSVHYKISGLILLLIVLGLFYSALGLPQTDLMANVVFGLIVSLVIIGFYLFPITLMEDLTSSDISSKYSIH